MESFDRAAHRYNTFAFVQRDLAKWLAEWLPVPQVGAALEIAAGTGVFTQQLAQWRGELTATDASPAMVEEGSSTCPFADWKIARADALPGLSANWIFSASYLQWAENPQKILAHWRTRLAPGGRILAGLFISPTLRELYEVLGVGAPLTWRSESDWRQAAEKAGFVIVRTEAADRTYYAPSSLDLLRSLHGTGAAPFRRMNPADLRTRMREYENHCRDEQGVRSTWRFFRLELVS